MSLHTHFGRSSLVRLLAQATGAGVGAPHEDVAERLSLWLNAFDAVALHGIHQAAQVAQVATAGPALHSVNGMAQQAVARQFQHTRTALVQAITGQGDPEGATGRRAGARATRATAPTAPAPEETVPDYSVFFKRHLALQREMAQKIEPLRAAARQALAATGPQLRPLAALDALLERTLGGREHKLLASVPGLLEKRFAQLRDAHLARVSATGQPDGPAQWRQPGGWLAGFGKEWEAIVLAELHLRLQPVVGMMEAWGASPQTTQ